MKISLSSINRYGILALPYVFFVMLWGQLWWLHLEDADYLRSKAIKARHHYEKTAAPRGDIVDARGIVIATSRIVWDVTLDPHVLQDNDSERIKRRLVHAKKTEPTLNAQSFEAWQQTLLNYSRNHFITQTAQILGEEEWAVARSFRPTYLPAQATPPATPTLRYRQSPFAFLSHASSWLLRPASAPQAPKQGKPRRWVQLAKNVDTQTVEKLERLKIPGMAFEPHYVRDYPMGKLAAHTVGYVSLEGKAVNGIEKALEPLLDGQHGFILSQLDGSRRELREQRMLQVSPENGHKVELTIDAVIQDICEKEISKAFDELNPQSISVIVSEPSTGRLLALANHPTYDLGNYASADQVRHMSNRALEYIYEPGSVFKIVPVCMALNEGVVKPEDVFDCTNILGRKTSYMGRKLPLPRDSHDLGAKASVRDIIRESSNIGSVLIATSVTEKLGEHLMVDYAQRFGFGQRTGLPISHVESRGTVLDPAHPQRKLRWDSLTISRMPMGHSIAATPIQTHYAMNVIANEGKLMTPLVINRILNADGSVFMEFEPKVRTQTLKPQTAKTMALMLRDVCRPGGTAKAANIEGYEVAGKTGTTQKYKRRPNGKYLPSPEHHVASFSGFFPAENPRIIITVVIDEPKMAKGVAYGGQYAAPVFKNIANQIIKHLRIPPAVRADALPNAI
ncbi:MAG: penicillin-binding protein 2 [Puniceicoccales bacterium]|jgi:cell division protein FtsI/penicillin-binding protein 2|nr:penicillin-binding protein 2 [Puniceicoccales bacterium]